LITLVTFKGRSDGLGRRKTGRRSKAQRHEQAVPRQGEVASRPSPSAQAVADLPLDILMRAARDETQPIEIRLAAARAAAPFFHAKPSSGPPKASFEMTQSELETAIAREKEHELRAAPGQHQIREVRR
jgi:hypothetical protein